MNFKASKLMVMGLAGVLLGGCMTAAPKGEWEGRKIAVFGDSLSDKRIDKWKQWWKWVGEELDVDMCVFARNGSQWNDVPHQLGLLQKSGDDVDAILVFTGTNDFNSDVPLGVWWTETEETVNRDGRMVKVKRRLPNKDGKTVRGRINIALEKIKSAYPDRQVVLMTPIRRGFFTCGKTNVQPEDSYANELGLYIGDYARVVREAGEVWSVPVIDMYSESGLVLSMPAYTDCCNRANTDRLHPCTEGCRRLALTVVARLKALPPTFRRSHE